MNSVDRSLRLAAGRELAKQLADPDLRKAFVANGWRPGKSVIIALEDDPISVVFAKAGRVHPPVTIAVFRPSDSTLRYLGMGPADTDEEPETEAEGVGGSSTIGMLLDYVLSQRTSFDSRLKFRVRGPRPEALAGVNTERFAAFAS